MTRRAKRGRITAAAAAAALCVPAAAAAGTPPFLVGTVAPHRVPAPVAAPPQLVPAPRAQPDGLDGDESFPQPRARGPQAKAHLAPLGRAAAGATTTSVLEGLSYDQSGGDPPDVTIAVGAGDVVEMTNVMRRVWTAGGTVLQDVSPLYSMFGTANDQISDPRVLFDTESGRWFASVMDIWRGTIVLAASTTANPLDAWTTWTLKLTASDDCFDQPKLGSADGKIVVGASAYARRNGLCAFSASAYAGGVIFALNKQELSSGGQAHWAEWGPNPDYGIPVPAQGLSASATAYAATNYSNGVGVLAVDGVPPAATLTTTFYGTAAFDDPPQAVQPGSALGVATNDARLLDAFWADGKLWTSGNSACRQGDGLDHACARVVAVSTQLGSVLVDTPLQQPGGDTYYPALRPDASGDVVVVYGVSSPAIFPSAAVIVLGADGTWSAPQVIRSGTAPLLLPRFGDYFGAARDPSLPNVVWVGGEYVGSGVGYQTAVGSIRTVQLAPAVDVAAAAAPAATSANVAGDVDPRGGDSTYWFEYGTSTAYGHATAHLTAAATAGRQHVTAVLVGLRPATTYHWRLVATNDAGTTAGADQQLRTKAAPKAKKKRRVGAAKG